MKVKDLIEQLKKYPDDLFVFQSSDPEGNSFYKVADVEEGTVDNVDKYKLNVFDVGVTKRVLENSEEFSEEDVRKEEVIILWP